MESTRITCYTCRADITTATGPNRYGHYLQLAARNQERNPDLSAERGLELPDPPLERDHHFCNLQCLATWVARLPNPPPRPEAPPCD